MEKTTFINTMRVSFEEPKRWVALPVFNYTNGDVYVEFFDANGDKIKVQVLKGAKQ